MEEAEIVMESLAATQLANGFDCGVHVLANAIVLRAWMDLWLVKMDNRLLGNYFPCLFWWLCLL